MSGIVHLGLGAFFRAHAAIYLKETMAQSGGDWRVIGASLRSPSVRDKLAPQSYEYTAIELNGDQQAIQTIDIIDNILVAPEDPAALVDAMAASNIRIVSLTVTEKAYSLEHAMQDSGTALPVTAPGFIVRALEKRWQQGLRPFTVLALDNLPANGEVIRRVVLELAEQINPELASWVAAEGRFPCTMVDRIVPATTADIITDLKTAHQINDAAPVAHEPFRQWVIEDNFVDDIKPDVSLVGAQWVDDVQPYELMKLRMLNGTHSTLAYMGSLAGHATVYDAIQDNQLSDFVDKLWREEIIPSFDAPEGIDLEQYAAALKSRYQNPAIKHQLEQIAMDGSQKLPQRILDSLFDNLNNKRPYQKLTQVVAAWLNYLRIKTQNSKNIDDPLATEIINIALQSSGTSDYVSNMLKLNTVFGQYPVQLIEQQLVELLSESHS